MEYTAVTVQREGGYAVLTFNQPKSMNALSEQMVKEACAAIDELEQDKDISVIILTGEGKAFVAGGDVGYMKDMGPAEAMAYSAFSNSFCERLVKSSKVIIAAINGLCLGGGCEIALACDLRIASEKAKFGFPEIKLGILPGCGGTQRLSRLVGSGRAKELIFTGKTIGAGEALNYGLVNRVTPAEEILSDACALATDLSKLGAVALAHAKDCIDKSGELSVEAGIRYERQAFGLCFATEDQKEGMAAFVERRESCFKGK